MNKVWLLGSLGLLTLSVAAACGDDAAGPGKDSGTKHSTGGGGADGAAGRDGSDTTTSAGGVEPEATGGAAVSRGGASSDSAGHGAIDEVAGAAGAGGASSPRSTVKSRPAGIELVIVDAERAQGLTFNSISITQEDDSPGYVEWLGELVNHGSAVQCLIQVKGDFQDADGTTVETFAAFADGPAYDTGASKLSSPCVAPGESVPVWANHLPEDPIALESITRLVVDIDPFAIPEAVVHPLTPALSELEKTYSPSFEEWEIAGTATSKGDIHNVNLTFWGKDGDFFVGSERAYHLDDFLAETEWEATTSPLGIGAESLSDVIAYFSFIEGLTIDARVRFDASTLAVIERRNEAMRSFAATRARRDSHRRSLGL